MFHESLAVINPVGPSPKRPLSVEPYEKHVNRFGSPIQSHIFPPPPSRPTSSPFPSPTKHPALPVPELPASQLTEVPYNEGGYELVPGKKGYEWHRTPSGSSLAVTTNAGSTPPQLPSPSTKIQPSRPSEQSLDGEKSYEREGPLGKIANLALHTRYLTKPKGPRRLSASKSSSISGLSLGVPPSSSNQSVHSRTTSIAGTSIAGSESDAFFSGDYGLYKPNREEIKDTSHGRREDNEKDLMASYANPSASNVALGSDSEASGNSSDNENPAFLKRPSSRASILRGAITNAIRRKDKNSPMRRATTLSPTPEVEVEDIANSQSDEAEIVPRDSLSLRKPKMMAREESAFGKIGLSHRNLIDLINDLDDEIDIREEKASIESAERKSSESSSKSKASSFMGMFSKSEKGSKHGRHSVSGTSGHQTPSSGQSSGMGKSRKRLSKTRRWSSASEKSSSDSRKDLVGNDQAEKSDESIGSRKSTMSWSGFMNKKVMDNGSNGERTSSSDNSTTDENSTQSEKSAKSHASVASVGSARGGARNRAGSF